MRARIAALTIAFGVAGAAAVVAVADVRADGLPGYTNGYTTWTKLNRKPVTTPGAHNGVKNIYASRHRGASGRFPNGTVIVKAIADAGAKGKPRQVAVMRKLAGRWRWVEYTRSTSTYGVLAQGQLCVSCHLQAKANDWVFTR